MGLSSTETHEEHGVYATWKIVILLQSTPICPFKIAVHGENVNGRLCLHDNLIFTDQYSRWPGGGGGGSKSIANESNALSKYTGKRGPTILSRK